MKHRFTRKFYNNCEYRNAFEADKVTVKVKEKGGDVYRIYGRYSSAKAANEVATELKDLCGYDVIVEY